MVETDVTLREHFIIYILMVVTNFYTEIELLENISTKIYSCWRQTLHRGRIIREHFNIDILMVETDVTPIKHFNIDIHIVVTNVYTEIELLENISTKIYSWWRQTLLEDISTEIYSWCWQT